MSIQYDETVREPIIMYTKITRLYKLTNLQFNSIISIEKVSIDKDKDKCSICLDDIEIDYAKLSCNHKYHIDCIKPWLMKYSLECPYCRRPILLDNRFYSTLYYILNVCYSIILMYLLAYLFVFIENNNIIE